MKIFDSALREKVELRELEKGKIRIYVCGPTVYDHSHLGHARSAICFDILRRVLRLNGYEVTFVRNFTDIDDKIVSKCLQNNQTPLELSNIYIESYLQDMRALNVINPDLSPRVSDFLTEITNFIKELLDKNIAYKLENGDIYLEVSKDSKYGFLSNHLSLENISRIEDSGKKNEKDFALWKAYKGDKDIGFDSILGKGRPGWHIECSAMINSALAYKDKEFAIDIHAGGNDLFFPHHENEACQTRTCTGKEISKYWMHNGFVNIDGEKMSKSLGNSFYIKDALKHYHGEILRNYLLGVHYRAVLNFNELDLLSSKKRLDKIYRLKKRVDFRSNFEVDFSGDIKLDPKIDSKNGTDFKDNFLSALNDDLNISLAFSELEKFIKDSNDFLDKSPKDKALKEYIKENLAFVDEVLGLGSIGYIEYFQLGVSQGERENILNLIEKRIHFKNMKDYKNADLIREELEKEGIILMDKTGNITEWEKV